MNTCFSAALFCLMTLTACTTTSAGRGAQDGFFIRDAALADEHYLSGLESLPADDRASDWSAMGLFAHRVSAGKGAILAYRSYSPGGLMVMDDESFEKVTIWFKRGLPELGTTEIPNNTMVVVHTRGGSAWPRSACSGLLTEGSINLAGSHNGFDVTIQGKLTLLGNRNPAWCSTERLELSFHASEMALSDVTPWLGTAGDHPYQESYRR